MRFRKQLRGDSAPWRLSSVEPFRIPPIRISVFVSHRSAITDQQSPISNHRSATRDTTGYEQGIVIRSMNRHGEASVNVILDSPVVFAPVVLNVMSKTAITTVPAAVWPHFLLLAHFVGRRRGALITNTEDEPSAMCTEDQPSASDQQQPFL